MMCGIVDLGSNTIRLSIYQYEGEHFRLLLNKKTMAGRAGYVQDGALSDGGILVACRVLSSYRALLSNFSVSEMHVFATASLRNISNTGEAVEAIRDVTGVTVEVLDGETEAALSFKGAVLPGGVPTWPTSAAARWSWCPTGTCLSPRPAPCPWAPCPSTPGSWTASSPPRRSDGPSVPA